MKRSKGLAVSSLAAVGLLVPVLIGATVSGGLFELAAQGRWDRVLEVASRRATQLPLSIEEKTLAAHAARELRDPQSEIRFLSDNGDIAGPLGMLAEVQLARLIVGDDSNRAVDLVLPAFPRTFPWPLRQAATDVAVGAVERGVTAERTNALEAAASKLTRSLRRRLELALALNDVEDGRSRLERLLAGSTRDLAALKAAEALAVSPSLTAVEQWRVASTWYRHALYDRAAPLFENLAEVAADGVPFDEVYFLRGRCAFRRGQWAQAASWYKQAVSLASRRDRRADFEVHLGRARELDGDLEAAVEAALRAVRLKTTDERRLFLVRLRLRRGEPDLAVKGISYLKSRTFRARGEMMMAADELRRGDGTAARSHLARVRGQEWSGPAAVLSASLAAGEGGVEDALAILDRAALVLDEYWIGQARRVMTTLPEENVEAWRYRHREELVEATGRTRWRILGRWARLEANSQILRELREHIAEEFFVSFESGPPAFPEGLAADLWRIGLERAAVRWDPSGFPRGEASASAWSASRFSEYDTPWTATRVADGAWRQAGSEVPNDALPVELQRSLYPLPMPELVRETAAAAGVDWSLLAAVAREESRWDHRALSAVGARGLLQLMPATSIAVASRIELPEPSADDLFVPQVNLALGAAELARLLAVFGGRNAPAIAAYNAGEEQAGLWLEQCGAGCSDGLYLVNISFASTRGYTAKVLASASRYSAIYGEDAEPVLETR